MIYFLFVAIIYSTEIKKTAVLKAIKSKIHPTYSFFIPILTVFYHF